MTVATFNKIYIDFCNKFSKNTIDDLYKKSNVNIEVPFESTEINLLKMYILERVYLSNKHRNALDELNYCVLDKENFTNFIAKI